MKNFGPCFLTEFPYQVSKLDIPQMYACISWQVLNLPCLTEKLLSVNVENTQNNPFLTVLTRLLHYFPLINIIMLTFCIIYTSILKSLPMPDCWSIHYNVLVSVTRYSETQNIHILLPPVS